MTRLDRGFKAMEMDAARMIGAGIAVVGLGGVGAGIGNIFATTIASLARNPAAQPLIQLPMWVGFALVEAVALYALVVALMLMFVF
jgi:ATP synthase F0 subunit c